MKSYFIKMMIIVLIISSFINLYKEKNKEIKVIYQNQVINNVFNSDVTYNIYQEEVVYEGLTLTELGEKLDKELNSTLKGYGKVIADKALNLGVDPIVATSIMLVETGCKWECSSLVKYNNNVGGMRSNGRYITYSTLEDGIGAFIDNLAYNYYYKGLNTPELINKKYATNPEWYKSVYYYVDLIRAS